MADKFWTHDRLAELRERWERGDPSADVATYFGKTVASVRTASQRQCFEHGRTKREAKRSFILDQLGTERDQTWIEGLMYSTVRRPKEKC